MGRSTVFNRREGRLETNIIYGHNGETDVLTAGTPVYIKDSVNDITIFGRADASDSSKMPSVGIVKTDLKPNEEGDVIIGGYASISIEGVAGALIGSPLYVANGGGLTVTPAGSFPQAISTVLSMHVPSGTVKTFIVAFGGSSAGGSSGGTLENLTDTPSGYGNAGDILISDGSGSFTYGAGSPWISDTDGIYYQAGNVGIGGNSDPAFDLKVAGDTYLGNDLEVFGLNNKLGTENAGTQFDATWEFDGNVPSNVHHSRFYWRSSGNKNAYNINYWPQLYNAGNQHYILSGNYSHLYIGGGNDTSSAGAKNIRTGSIYTSIRNLSIGSDVDNPSYTFPNSDGTASQFLQTDGAGNLSFADVVQTWEEVAYTSETAIKYESGVVGIKASGTAYSTNTNLLAKAGQFPINTGSYSTTSSGVDALMHLHEGRIIYTTNDSTTESVAISLLGTTHATTDYGSIGLNYRKLHLRGGEGVYLGTGSISTLVSASSNSNILVLGNQNWDTRGGIQLDGDTGPPTNYMKIVMGGQIIFHGHTASKYVAISRRGTYGTDGGVQMGAAASGLFANFAASDGNTPGSFGYLGINVDNPQVSGPAFEVSSSHGTFNDGLTVGGTVGSNWYSASVVGKIYLNSSGTVSGSVVIAGNNPAGSNTTASVYIGPHNVASGTGQANASIVIGRNTAGGTGAYHESVIIGDGALAANTGGTRTSVLIGYAAGGGGNMSYSNTGVGFNVLGNASGTYNAAVGEYAGHGAAGGGAMLGRRAGFNATGSNNTFVGREADNASASASSVGNVVIGGLNKNVGNTNVIVGYQTDLGVSGATVSGFHTIVGSLITLSATSTFTSTTIIGKDAGKNGSVVRSVLMGESASAGGSSTDSTIIGYQAVYNGGTRVNSTIIGYKAAVNSYDSGTSTSASATTIIGTYAGYHTKGAENVYIGRSAGMSYDQGVAVVQTGGNNVAIGSEAGYHLTTSNNNVLIGRAAGYNVTTTSGNVMIGYQAGYSEAGGNKLYISNSNTTTPLIYGEFDNNIVQIHNTSTGRMGFYPSGGPSGHNAVMQIADADYFGHTLSGSVDGYGLAIVHRSTIAAPTGGSYKLKGVIIGNDFDLARNPGEWAYGGIVIANGLTSDITVGNSALPGVAIGANLDFTGYSNNAQSVVIGNGRPSNAAYGGVAIAGNQTIRPLGNGVSIQAQSGGSSVNGVAIMGRAAGYSIAIGEDCNLNGTGSSPGTFIGRFAAKENSGQQVTAVGTGALQWVSGFGNTAVGSGAISGNTSVQSGRDNTGMGVNVLADITSGSYNVGIGNYAGNSKTTGSSNTYIGFEAGDTQQTGSNNVAVGRGTMGGVTTSITNATHIGTYAGESSTASNTTFVGTNAGHSSLIDNSVAVGFDAARQAFNNGTQSVCVGYEAGYSGGSGIAGVSIGYKAGYFAKSSYNTLIGHKAGEYISDNASGNLGVNTAVGTGALQFQEPSYCVAIGFRALRGGTSDANNSHSFNVAIGAQALQNITTGDNNMAIGYFTANDITTGHKNALIGTLSGEGLTTGNGNVGIGYKALSQSGSNPSPGNLTGEYNIAIGQEAGQDLTTASNCVYIGRYSGTKGLLYGEVPGIDSTTDYAFVLRGAAKAPIMYGDMSVGTGSPTDSPGFMRSPNFQMEWRTVYSSAVDANQMYYVTGLNSIAKADASSASTATGMLIFTLGTSIPDDSAVMTGHVAYTISGTVGDKVYLSTTAGALTTTAPTGTGEIVRVVGYISSTNQVYLNPSTEWVEI